jgi:hypothetical protein
MATRIAFLDKELSLDVTEHVDLVRTKLEQEARSGRWVEFSRRTPQEGAAVWINPAAVAFFHEALEYETHSS